MKTKFLRKIRKRYSIYRTESSVIWSKNKRTGMIHRYDDISLFVLDMAWDICGFNTGHSYGQRMLNRMKIVQFKSERIC